MNNDGRQRLITSIGIIVVTILLLGMLLFTLFKPKKTDENASRSQDVTSFYSPVSKNSDSLTVNYGSDVQPNTDAVKPQFKVFGIDQLPLSQDVRNTLTSVLPGALLSKLAPTYPVTYVHVETDSIRCDAGDNCKMNLYIDSPETYFSFYLKTSGDAPSFTLTQIPWKGLN